MDNRKDMLLKWMDDTYAMEQSIARTLEEQRDDFKGNIVADRKLQEHIEITKSQADRLKSRIEELGGSVSQIKGGMAAVMGTMQGSSTELAEDKMVKDAIADFATENFEIASYKSLIAAAEEVGDQKTTALCQEILKEEEEMRMWLDKRLSQVVKDSMNKIAAE